MPIRYSNLSYQTNVIIASIKMIRQYSYVLMPHLVN